MSFHKFHIIILLSLNSCLLFGQDLHTEIEKIIMHDTDISYELTPGFVVAIIDGDSTYYESFGSKADERRSPLSKDDVFEIGSVTKLFTATIIDIASYEKMINLTDPVNEYLPLAYQNPRMKKLSIKDLLNHQSGLPKRPYGFGLKEVESQNPYKYYSKDDLLKSYSIFVQESNEAIYSHMNYALLEIILESVYGKSYNEILFEKILLPLNMNQSFVHFKEDKSILTAGLDRSGSQVTPWEFNSFTGSEGIKSSLSDLVKFVRANLGTIDVSLTSILDDNFEEDHTSFNDKIVVSTGWQIFKINKRLNAALHTGSTSGHSAFVGMIRETDTAVIVLSNSTFGTKDLGMLVLRMVNDNWKRKSN
jgi:CubicO group peptidase (beta-lactamase class C family)